MGDPNDESRGSEFARHAANYLLGGAAAAIVGFGTTALLTRLLNPGEFGILEIFLSIIPVFAVLVEINLRGALSRYYLEETGDFDDFLKTILLFLGGLVIVNLGVAWVLREPLAGFYRIAPELFFVGVVCAALTVPWNLNWKLMVAQMNSAAYSRLRVLRDVIILGIAAIWLFSLPPGTEAAPTRHVGMIYATLVGNLIIAVGLLWRLLRVASGGAFRRRHLNYALAFGIPLIPHALSGHILTLFDRIVVMQVEGDVSTGLYSFAYKVGMGMNMVVGAMNQAWLPVFVRARNREQHSLIHGMAWRYAMAVAALAVVLVLFAREAAMILADERYMEALNLVPIIVLSYVMLFMYTIYANYSFYVRSTWLISAATFVAAAANVVLNYLLIPRFGYVAAAWTTLASYGLMFVMHYMAARFVLGEKVPPLWPQLVCFMAAAGASAGVVAMEQAIDNFWVALLAMKLPLGALLVGGFLVFRRRLASSYNEDIDDVESADEGSDG